MTARTSHGIRINETRVKSRAFDTIAPLRVDCVRWVLYQANHRQSILIHVPTDTHTTPTTECHVQHEPTNIHLRPSCATRSQWNSAGRCGRSQIDCVTQEMIP